MKKVRGYVALAMVAAMVVSGVPATVTGEPTDRAPPDRALLEEGRPAAWLDAHVPRFLEDLTDLEAQMLRRRGAAPSDGEPLPRAGGRSVPVDGTRTPHPPIQIVGDEGPRGFIVGHDPTTGDPIYRPGSGVVAGNGTAGDPYVIEGWRTSAISLASTSAHVVIRDNGIRPQTPLEATSASGIGLTFASNVTVADNDVATAPFFGGSGNGVAFQVLRSDDVTVRDNRVVTDGRAVVVQESPGVGVVGNRLLGADHPLRAGVVVDRSPGTLVADNRVDLAFDAVRIEGSDGSVVASNRLGRAYRQIDAVRSADLVIRDNALGGRYTDYPLLLRASPSARIDGNAIDGADDAGIVLYRSPHAELTDNRLRRTGIELLGYRPAGLDHTIPPSNLVNGEPVRYVHNASSVRVDQPAGQVLVTASRDVVVADLVLGPTSTAVAVTGGERVRVRNVTVRGSRTGVSVVDARLVRLRDVAVDGAEDGVWIYGADDPTLNSTRVQARDTGIALYGTSSPTVTDSRVRDAEAGIALIASSHGLFARNRFSVSGFLLYGGSIAHHAHDIDASNLVNGEPVRYVRNQTDARVTGDAGQVLVVGSPGARVAAPDIDTTSAAVLLAFSPGSRVVSPELRANDVGVQVLRSPGAGVEGGTLADNEVGIDLRDTLGAEVLEVRVRGGQVGVSGWNATHASVHRSRLTGAVVGLNLYESPGLYVTRSRVAEHGIWGIGLYESPDASLLENEIRDNGYTGIDLDESGRAEIHHNNIAGNRRGLDDDSHGRVEARLNWWGCPEGPAAGYETGRCDTIDGNASFAPWSTSPHDDAGP